jgi:hypothetical protein
MAVMDEKIIQGRKPVARGEECVARMDLTKFLETECPLNVR